MVFSYLSHILGGNTLQSPHPEAEIGSIFLDTRHLPLPDAVFFAINGQRHNGHQYGQDAYQAGVRNLVLSQKPDHHAFPEANILLVEDTLAALQALAQHHRAQFTLPVIGITGSNGKTIVKEWLYQILEHEFTIVRSPKSYNSQVGVPLSVWEIHTEHHLGIFEAGISQPGEMHRLSSIIQPKIGIFTNIGPAHSEGFSSEMAKIEEKMLLFEGASTLVCRSDSTAIYSAAQAWQRVNPNRTLWAWSSKDPAATVFLRVVKQGDTTHLVFSWAGNQATAVIPFSDDAAIENATHCFVGGLALGVPADILIHGLAHIRPIEMRMELRLGVEDSTLVNDFYNNDLASLQILLQFARQQSKGKQVTLILSDILQSGQTQAKLYRQVGLLLKGVDRFIGIGTEILAIEPYLPKAVTAAFYPDTASFLQDVKRFSWRNNLVLIKGARPFELERVAQRLEKKAHQTRLEINLTALIHNLKVYNSRLQPGVKTMVMVKAAAYGSGSTEVARLLEFHKVNYLGVAYPDEGIELRQAGVQLPILVLNPHASDFDLCYRYQLEPEIYSPEMLRNLSDHIGSEKQMVIHLKLDTGMHRLGFIKDDLDDLIIQLRLMPNIRVATVFTHLSATDNPVHDVFTHHQAAQFIDMYRTIEVGLGYSPIRHIVNTSGIARFPQYHFDMVRLGIGLYGIDGGGLQKHLQMVNVLKTSVSQIKNIPMGDTVGYNRNSGVLNQPRKIATIGIGYADGFLRLAGGGRYSVLINNQLAPTIGNVCMDMTMVDITHIEGVKAGDEVVVFGQKPSVEDLANSLQTIAYEIFTNISDRVKRVYVQE